MRLLAASLFAVVAACSKESPPAPATPPAASAPPSAPAPSSVAPAAASAKAPEAPAGKTVETPAGTAREVGGEIQIAGKPIYPPVACGADPKDGCAKVKALRGDLETVRILRHFDGPDGARSILLVQVMPAGNACNGGPLFFARVPKDGAVRYSQPFDYCGGPDPQVGALADKVVITVPAHAPNRGKGTIPAEGAEYDIATGVLKRTAKK